MTNERNIGFRIKRLREMAPGKPTQIEMAVAIGIGRSTLAGIEAGIALPGRETLVAIADYLLVGVDDILMGQHPAIGENQQPSPGKRKAAERKGEIELIAAWRIITPEDQAIVLSVAQGFAQRQRRIRPDAA